MAILPLSLARVSNLMRSNIAGQTIAATEQQLLDVQNQLSTGKRLNAPSDDPGSSAIAMQLRKTLETRNSYLANITSANSQLSEVDSTLGDLTNLLQQAQSIASANVGSDVTPDQRKSAAAVVQSLYNQALGLGNKEFNGSFLFAGDKSTAAPFVESNGGVKFVGSNTVLQNVSDENSKMAFQVAGGTVFGALSSQVQGATNLAPSVTATTRLVDLDGATNDGVRLGTVSISNGATTAAVDLSKADTLGDVVTAINAAAVGGITASLSATGIQLTGAGGDNITVNEVGGGTTASDLGILTTTGGGAGAPVNGAGVQPQVTNLTQLADLKGGAGIDTAGLIITNGQQSATISLAGVNTVEDLLNKINGSKAGVLARINSNGTGIDIVNPTQGTTMTIAEDGGTTAADLGLRSFSPTTQLTDLNGGKGVKTVASGDFAVTRKDGSTFNVSLTGAVTVQDAINAINTADGGGGVTASFATTGNGLVLTDTTGGSGALTVTNLNFSTAAADLGLPASTAGAVATASDVNPVAVDGVFGNLLKLEHALQSSDQTGITTAAEGLKTDYDRVVQTRGVNGAAVKELEARQSRIEDENIATKNVLSTLEDTDFTSAIAKFQTLQTSLQATLQTTGKVLNLSLLDFLT